MKTRTVDPNASHTRELATAREEERAGYDATHAESASVRAPLEIVAVEETPAAKLKAAHRRGGVTRSRQPSAQEARSTGGKVTTGQQASRYDEDPQAAIQRRRAAFLDLQAERAKNGFQALCDSGRRGLAMQKIANWQREHPSGPERWVRAQLEARGLVEGTDFERAVDKEISPNRWVIMDFVITGPERVVVYEPGDPLWHGGPTRSIDGRDYAALDQERGRAIRQATGWTWIALDSTMIERDPASAHRFLTAALRLAGFKAEVQP